MKKLSKKWKIFITTVVILIGSFYGYYKINNRNAFEEMFNSYYNFVPISALYNMPQIEPTPRDEIGLEIAKLYYKEKVDNSNIKFTLVALNEVEKVGFSSSTVIDEGVYLDIGYVY